MAAWWNRPLQPTPVQLVAAIDIVAGLIWMAIAARAWWWQASAAAVALVGLSTLVILAGALVLTRAPGLYLLALAINLAMALWMAGESAVRVYKHIFGGYIPRYWVPITHTVLSVGQAVLFAWLVWQLWRLYRERRAELTAAQADDLPVPQGWDEGR